MQAEHVVVTKWKPDGRVAEFVKTPISVSEAYKLLDVELQECRARVAARQREEAVKRRREHAQATAQLREKDKTIARLKADAELAALEAKAKRVVKEFAERSGEDIGRKVLEAIAKQVEEKLTPELKATGYKVSMPGLDATMRDAARQIRAAWIDRYASAKITPTLTAIFNDVFAKAFWKGVEAAIADEIKRPYRC